MLQFHTYCLRFLFGPEGSGASTFSLSFMTMKLYSFWLGICGLLISSACAPSVWAGNREPAQKLLDTSRKEVAAILQAVEIEEEIITIGRGVLSPAISSITTAFDAETARLLAHTSYSQKKRVTAERKTLLLELEADCETVVRKWVEGIPEVADFTRQVEDKYIAALSAGALRESAEFFSTDVGRKYASLCLSRMPPGIRRTYANILKQHLNASLHLFQPLLNQYALNATRVETMGSPASYLDRKAPEFPPSAPADIERVEALVTVLGLKQSLPPHYASIFFKFNMAGRSDNQPPSINAQKWYMEVFNWEEALKRVSKAYHLAFSNAEIDAITAFYQSPSGKELLYALPFMSNSIIDAALIPLMSDEVNRMSQTLR